MSDTQTAQPSNALPVIGFCAASGTGKTTLLRFVIGMLTESGLRVGAIKQARDNFDIDQPGKDSDRLRRAGIQRLLLGSERQSALIIERTEPGQEVDDPELDQLIGQFDQSALDIVVVEGFANAAIPKIELIRSSVTRRAARYKTDPWVVAIATDSPEKLTTELPVIDIDDPWAVSQFIRDYISTGPSTKMSQDQG